MNQKYLIIRFQILLLEDVVCATDPRVHDLESELASDFILIGPLDPHFSLEAFVHIVFFFAFIVYLGGREVVMSIVGLRIRFDELEAADIFGLFNTIALALNGEEPSVLMTQRRVVSEV